MMGRMIYRDGRTALTTTEFRYKLTDPSGTLVKDWTTGATWTEEPAGTYYLDDAAAVPGTYYAVEPATGEVGATGQVPWGKPAAAGDAMTLTAAYDHAKDDVLTPLAVVDGKVDSILEDTSTSIPTSIAELPTDADVQTAARAALDDYAPTTWRDIPTYAEIQAAAQAAIVAQPATLTAAYDKAKDDVLTPLAVVDGLVDGIAADYAKTGEAAAAINVYQPLRASDYVEARNDLIIDIEERTRAIDGKVNTVDSILDTILPLIRRVYRYFFNKRTHTNSSVVVYADDGVTPDATMAVSGDTTTVTKSAPE